LGVTKVGSNILLSKECSLHGAKAWIPALKNWDAGRKPEGNAALASSAKVETWFSRHLSIAGLGAGQPVWELRECEWAACGGL